MNNENDSPINIVGDPKSQRCFIVYHAGRTAINLCPMEAAKAAAHLLNAALRSCAVDDMETVRDAYMQVLIANAGPLGTMQ